MRIVELQDNLKDFASLPSPESLVCTCENLLESLFTGAITLRQAWEVQEKLEYTGTSPEVSCNVIRVTHTTWEILESYAELSQEHDEYPLGTLQNALTELHYIFYKLRTTGWESVCPYMRAYYEKRKDGRVIASLALTSFICDGDLHAFTGETILHKKLRSIVAEAKDLHAVDQALPLKLAGWGLRNVVYGHALESDFKGAL